MQNMDSYILHWWGWKLSRVWFLKWVCCVPPNIVSSRVSPQHQSSAVTISLQKLTFSAFISFITLKRFKPTKHNISVSITCSPSQRSKISNVDTFMQEFDRNYDSLTSPQKNHTRKEYCCWTLKSPSLIFEEPMMKESKNTRLTILRQNSNRSLQSADPRGAAQMINYRLAAAASKKKDNYVPRLTIIITIIRHIPENFSLQFVVCLFVGFLQMLPVQGGGEEDLRRNSGQVCLWQPDTTQRYKWHRLVIISIENG